MVIAETGGLAGCAYGFPMRGNGFWSRDFVVLTVFPSKRGGLACSWRHCTVQSGASRFLLKDTEAAQRRTEELTRTERDVLRLLGTGLSNAEIADHHHDHRSPPEAALRGPTRFTVPGQ